MSVQLEAARAAVTEAPFPERSRMKRSAVLLGVLLALGWLGLVGHSLLQARDHGRQAVVLARGLSVPADPADADPAALRAQLLPVTVELDAAGAALDAPWMVPARSLPWVGTQLRSAAAMTRTTAETLRAGSLVLDALERLRVDVRNGTVTPAAGLADLRGSLARLSAAARGGLGPRQPLLGALARGHEELAGRLDEVAVEADRAGTVVTGASWFLDGGRYLMLFANPAEARMGGGMFLQAGLLEVGADGSLELADTRHGLELRTRQQVGVQDAALAGYWGGLLPSELYQNTAMTPRFPAVAEQAARMWSADGGGELDGVIAADPALLQSLLRLTGPVAVGGVELTADTVLAYLAVGQYAGADAPTDARRDALGEVVSATLARLDVTRIDPLALVGALRGPAQGRHLKLWSHWQPEQDAWSVLGVDGSVAEEDLLVAVSNHQPSKLDSYLAVQASLVPQRSGQTTRYVLTLEVANTATGTEPPYVLGYERPGEYFGILAAYLPGGAQQVQWNGMPAGAAAVTQAPQFALAEREDDALVAAGPEGLGVIAARTIELGPGERRTVTVQFELPTDRAVRVVPSGRLPGISWTTPGVSDAAPVWVLPDGSVRS